VLEQRDYGGHVLALVYPLIRWQKMRPPDKEQLLDTLIHEDRRILEAGYPSFYTVLVAERPRGSERPEQGPSRPHAVRD